MFYVSVWTLIGVLWQTWRPDIHLLASTVAAKDFSFGGWLLPKTFVIRSMANAKKVLAATSRLSQTYHAFARAADLKFDFTATNAGSVEHTRIHKALLEAMSGDKERIPQLVEKHLPVFLQYTQDDLQKAFDRFFTAFWCDYLFGSAIEPYVYSQLKDRLTKVMHKRFYDRQWKSVFTPCFFDGESTVELQHCKQAILEMVNSSIFDGENLMTRFASNLMSIACDDVWNNTVKDVAFNLFFQPDFLRGVILASLTRKLCDTDDAEYQSKGLSDAFLFPFRGRILDEPVQLDDGTVLPTGATVFVNLLDAELYHSWGQRPCPGRSFTNLFKQSFFNLLDTAVKLTSDKIIAPVVSTNKDVPTVPIRQVIFSWIPRRNYLQLPSHQHATNSSTMRDVLAIYANVFQFNLVISYLYQKLPQWPMQNIVLVAPEARALSLAGALAARAKLPLVTIRKQGGNKMQPLELVTASYFKGYDQTQKDTVELPIGKKALLEGKYVVLVDDGIASGQSLAACEKLVLLLGAKRVLKSLCMVNHTYFKGERACQAPVDTVFDV
jgi:adenine/guanine phosphoribosyltransferase-like PRPP-binding protein